jgi:PPOX class probable F420-dependent enzyme
LKLSPAEARERFGAARVARLATVSGTHQPHLVPFTFALVRAAGAGDAGDLIVHAVDHKPKVSTDLKRLRNIAENGQVAALADGYSDDWNQLWWARADGVAEIRTTLGADLHEMLAGRYPQYRDRRPDGPFVVIRVGRWSGWSA